MRTFIAIVVWCALVVPQLVAGQQQTLRATPLFRASVRLDLVDVVVRDARTGRLVRGLKKDEFAILDDDRPQKIASFAAVDLPATRNPQPPRLDDRIGTNETPGGRIILFLVNDPSMSFGTTAYLRDLLRRFVDRHMSDTDQVAIWTTSVTLPIQGFTSNRARLDAVVDRLQGTRSLDYDPYAALYTLDYALNVLAPFSDERKIIVYLGGGPPLFRGPALQLQDVEEFNRVLGEAAAANVAIYPVSVRGVTGHIALGLDILADYTGGVVAHRNDFDRVLDRIEQDAGSYYLLGFSPQVSDRRAGRLHRLRVRVRRPGVTVVARSRYMPFPFPHELYEPSPDAASVADMAAAPLERRQLPLRLQAARFGGRGTVVVTVRADLPGQRFAGRTVEYAIEATDDRGRVAAATSGASVVPRADNVPSITIVSPLELKPGLLTVEAALKTDDGLGGSVFLDVDLPEPDRGLEMSDIEVAPKVEHTIVLGTPPSFLTTRLPNAPDVQRTFAASDTLTLYGEVYSPGENAKIGAVMTVRSGNGGVERSVELALAPEAPASGRSSYHYVGTLPLDGLARGAHSIEVTASDGHGRTASKTIEIRIGAAT